MAQAQGRGSAFVERMRLVLGQRPGYAVAAALVAAALLAAALVGVVEAGGADGVVILSSEASSEDTQASDADAGQDGEDAAGTADADDSSASDTVVVDIDGAVASPSVVELPAGSRVADAIEAAGGLTDDADVSGINRAAVLTDGEKIYIPAEGEETTSSSSSSSSSSTASSTADSSGLVNINTADADELDTLPGIGPALAQAIIDDREANGAFASIEDITRVSGIGEAKYANIKDLICV